jgi:hypothetical protein
MGKEEYAKWRKYLDAYDPIGVPQSVALTFIAKALVDIAENLNYLRLQICGGNTE